MNSADIDRQLDELLEYVVRLDVETLRRIRSDWESADEAERAAVWSAVHKALKRTRRGNLMDETRERVRRWVNATPSVAGGFYGAYPVTSWTRFDELETRARVAPAILDAAAAIIADDQLSDDERALLLDPLKDPGAAENPETGPSGNAQSAG